NHRSCSKDLTSLDQLHQRAVRTRLRPPTASHRQTRWLRISLCSLTSASGAVTPPMSLEQRFFAGFIGTRACWAHSAGAQRANDRARIATPTIQDVAQVEAPATQGGEPDNTASLELLWVFASRTVDTAARDKKNNGLVEAALSSA